jgi:beta-glucanase (GH16 family)
MLGSDYATNTWPGCGEIDIMEYKGSEPNKIQHSIIQLLPGAGNTNSTTIVNAASEFHIYKTI